MGGGQVKFYPVQKGGGGRKGFRGGGGHKTFCGSFNIGA